MRLRSGAQVGEGRVEVLMNRQWGTVCDHRWNLISASVVCRQLGFGSAREALFGAQLGQGEHGGPGCVRGPECTTRFSWQPRSGSSLPREGKSQVWFTEAPPTVCSSLQG